MSSFTRNSLIIVSLLVFTAAILFKVQSILAKTPVSSVDLTNIPYEIGPWKGKDFPVSKDVYEILETDDVLIREYLDETGYPVVVAIVFADKMRGSFHPPEICYTGAGTELIGKEVETMNLSDGTLLNTNKLVLKSEKESVTAWYWYMAGEKSMASFYRQQLFMLKDTLTQKPLQGALIRVSIQEHNELGEAKANQFIQDFSAHLADMY